MFLPERMRQISVLVFESELDEVARAIVRLGILHLSRLDEQESWVQSLRGYEAAQARGRIDLLRSRMTTMLKNLGLDELALVPGESLSDLTTADPAEIERFLSSLEAKLQGPLAKRAEISRSLERMMSVASEISPLLELGLSAEKTAYTFLEVHYGEVHPEQVDEIKEKIAPLAAVVYSVAKRGKNDLIVLIGLKTDRLKLKKILRDAGFEEIEMTPERKKDTGMTGELLRRIEEAKVEIAAIDRRVVTLRETNREQLARYSRLLRVSALMLRFKNASRATEKTAVFSGWVPVDQLETVEREIMRAANGRAIIEVHDPDDVAGVREGRVKVPVLLKHPTFLKPFGLLISSYATPDYKTIDPTFFMAITFLFMFGLMFGDVGHGAVLLALGWLVHRRAKSPDDTMALFGRLGAYCGASSIVFGILFGSVFGLEELIPHLWMKPMGDIPRLLKFAVYYGVCVIALGLAFNMFNSIMRRNFVSFVFDHGGLLVAILYWAGVSAVAIFMRKAPIPGWLIPVGFGVPIIILFLKEPIIAIARRKKLHFEHGVGMYLFESFLEVMEIFTGYLSNTV